MSINHVRRTRYSTIRRLLTVESVSQPVSQSLHFKRVTRFTHNDITVPEKPPANVQPKGLRARIPPFGVPQQIGNIGTIGEESDEDVEMGQAPPLATETPKAVKKRKHAEENDKPASGKKSKKAKVAESHANGAKDSAKKPVKQTPVAPPTIPSAAKKAVAETPSKPSSAAAGASARKMTPILPPSVPGSKKKSA